MHKEQERKNGWLIAFIFLLILVVMALAFYGRAHASKQAQKTVITAPVKIDGTVLPKPRVITAFDLTQTDGKPYTRQNLNGHWTLMFFGFTNCPLVCPTTMTELNKMYHQLQKEMPANKLPAVVMVSVDPGRDSLKRLKGYVSSFNTQFTGLRGDIAHVQGLARQMNVVFTKITFGDGDKDHYTISHSAEIMLLNPKGNLVAFLSYPHKAKTMAMDYEHIVAKG
jgi:protein SCO1